MDGLTPVQISELVTLLEDAISACATRLEQGAATATTAGGAERASIYNEIDHLEAELAWIQWMRENHPDHEESGFPSAAVAEHIQGMRGGIERWRVKLLRNDAHGDANYIHSLENSIAIVGNILEMFDQVGGLG
jgi:hypothetical protein